MKKTLFSLLVFGLLSVSVQAQKRDWAVGLRLGDPMGVNVKKYFGSGNALDVNVGSTGSFYGGGNYRYKGYNGYYNSGLALMVNYVWQKSISGAKGLDWYWGLGGQLSSRRFYYDDQDYYVRNGKMYVRGGEYRSTAAIGATGILGLEWFIPNAPISLYGDAGLYLELVPAPLWVSVPAAIGGRFNF